VRQHRRQSLQFIEKTNCRRSILDRDAFVKVLGSLVIDDGVLLDQPFAFLLVRLARRHVSQCLL